MATKIDVTDADFQQLVIEASQNVPVVVDFWAPWCGPCRALGPVLEQLADEANGEWELVKVNVDDSPGLAVRFGIQGIPAVKAFFERKEVAGFVGAQPRPQIETWLGSFLPDPSRELVAAAQNAERQGDRASAKRLFEQAVELNPANQAARQGLERIALLEAAGAVGEAGLVARLESDPNDVQTATQLAKLKLAGDDPEFFDPLVGLISRSEEEAGRKAARAALLDLLEILPPDDPRVAHARRRLASVLYR